MANFIDAATENSTGGNGIPVAPSLTYTRWPAGVQKRPPLRDPGLAYFARKCLYIAVHRLFQAHSRRWIGLASCMGRNPGCDSAFRPLQNRDSQSVCLPGRYTPTHLIRSNGEA